VFADTCHFDGGQTGILAEGPADITLRDCTMGPGQPSFWLDNSRATGAAAGELHIANTSVLAGAGPVFRFDRSQVRVWIDDSVIAPVGRSPATLVMIDNPRDLTWRGRSNLYGNIGVYLGYSDKGEKQEAITEFARWKETAAGPRETGTMVATSAVWDAPDPAQAQATEIDNPTRVFLLNSSISSRTDVGGARRGPFGSILKNVRIAQRARPDDGDAIVVTSSRDRGSESPGRSVLDPATRKDETKTAAVPVPVSTAGADPPSAGAADDLANMPTMPPMASPPSSLAQAAAPAGPAASTEAGTPTSTESPRREESARAASAGAGSPPEPSQSERKAQTIEHDVIRDAEQFERMFKRLGSRGGTLRIAAGADLDLSTITIEGTGRYQFVAEPGARRPRLRFHPSQVVNRSPASWSVMLSLRSGSLHVQGIDLVVPDQESLHGDRPAAAGLLSGCELTLTDCTLTVATDRPGAALFVVQPAITASKPQDPGGEAGRSAVIRIRDSFLRSGGEGITVAAGRRVDVELSNVLASTEASLVHAFGGDRPGRADDPAVKLRMNQVTARVKGGLIHLDSTPDEPEIPFAAIVAETSIISTANRDDPLFRVDGRDQLDDLGDKIRWEGRKVAYDRIKTYRRDEVVRTGASPRIYNRADWTSAFLPKDEASIVGEVKFLRETDPTQAAWKLERDDLQLAPQSPVVDIGPDVSRIPQAPAASEL
jgi:serine/threonine-protein kinase